MDQRQCGDFIVYSVVVPVYNEGKNIPLFFSSLRKTMESIGKDFEIIFVDDGSQDDTAAIIKKETQNYPYVKLLSFKQNFGKSFALQSGFEAAQGNYVITLDGDCQYDTDDIKLLLKEIETKKLDIMCGWRKFRKDPFFKKFFSKLANWLRVLIFRESIHDVGCAFRVYSREPLKDMRLKREQHRFVTVILKKKGYSIGEAIVNHYPRKNGRSKYGIWDRFIKSVPDFICIALNKN